MMPLKIYRYFPLFLSLMFLITSCVADTTKTPTPTHIATDDSDKGLIRPNRFALVIGNTNYEREKPPASASSPAVGVVCPPSLYLQLTKMFYLGKLENIL